MLYYHYPCMPQISWFGTLFPPKDTLGPFSDAKKLLQHSIWTFCVNLWLYKVPCVTVGTYRGSYKTAPVHIEWLKSLNSSTNFSKIVSLPCIIASVRKAVYIVLSNRRIWLPVSLLWGEGVPEIQGVPPKSTNDCRTVTVHLR